jgi:hypothetical protein
VICRRAAVALPHDASAQDGRRVPYPREGRTGIGALAQPAPPAARCARHEPAFAALVGRDGSAVRGALAATSGHRTIRAVAPDAPVTLDHRAERATLLVDRGVVRAIACG